jgi:glycerol-3-phosphate acyltransferase PlsY
MLDLFSPIHIIIVVVMLAFVFAFLGGAVAFGVWIVRRLCARR